SNAATARGRISWRSWSTTRRWGSPTSCAASTCSTARRAKCCCSARWGCPRRATLTYRSCRAATERSCPSATERPISERCATPAWIRSGWWPPSHARSGCCPKAWPEYDRERSSATSRSRPCVVRRCRGPQRGCHDAPPGIAMRARHAMLPSPRVTRSNVAQALGVAGWGAWLLASCGTVPQPPDLPTPPPGDVATPEPAPEARLTYPASPRGDTYDDYHGTRVADPYRWLEDNESAETRAWIEAQNEVTQAYLAEIPARAHLRERLTALWNYPRWG